MKEVKKLGSQWSGEVWKVSKTGNLVTNFRTADVVPLAQSSKLWFQLGSITIRGIFDPIDTTEKGKIRAVPGPEGLIEIMGSGGSAEEISGIKPGAPIILNFRV